MARTKEIFHDELRVQDYLTTGLLMQLLPMERIRETLKKYGKGTMRERKLPREILVYYVISMGLLAQKGIREVLKYLLFGLDKVLPNIAQDVAHESAISQARERLGEDVMKDIFRQICHPLAEKGTPGAWFKKWRLVAIDGSEFNLQDEAEIREEFPKHSNGKEYPQPQMKFASLVELGTRCIFDAAYGNDHVSEHALAKQLLPSLDSSMLVMGDRLYMCYDLFQEVNATGAAILFRAKSSLSLKPEKILSDNSYTARIYKDHSERRHSCGIEVRVIEYEVKSSGTSTSEIIRLVTNIMSPEEASAKELARLYPFRWGIEGTYLEMKTRMFLPTQTLRSKRADLAKQEFWGLLIAHYLIRFTIYSAAIKNNLPPTELSVKETINIIHRRSVGALLSPPIGKEH